MEKSLHTKIHANSSTDFHFPYFDKPKYLQVRLHRPGNLLQRNLKSDDSALSSNNEIASSDGDAWTGEFSISKAGSFHIQIREASLIVKVHVESVGASLVTTLSAESTLWPPFRIENMTSFDVRYKQHSSRPVILKGLLLKNWDRYDPLPANSRTAYAWDYPHTGNKTIRVEFPQASSWVGVEVPIEELTKTMHITLRKKPPDLTNAMIEGHLLRYDSGTDSWISSYCVLNEDLLYVFENEGRDGLITIGSLVSSALDTASRGVVVATVFPSYSVKVLESGAETIGNRIVADEGNEFSGERIASRHDSMNVNAVRMLLVKVAVYLGLVSKDDLMAEEVEEECIIVADESALNENAKPENSVGSVLYSSENVDKLFRKLRRYVIPLPRIILALQAVDASVDMAAAVLICKRLIFLGVLVKPSAYVHKQSTDRKASIAVRGSLDLPTRGGGSRKDLGRGDSSSTISRPWSLTQRLTGSQRIKQTINVVDYAAEREKLLESLSLTLNVFVVVAAPDLSTVDDGPENSGQSLGGSSRNFDNLDDAEEEDPRNLRNAFTIRTRESEMMFMCQSSSLFVRWIHACRLVVEIALLKQYLNAFLNVREESSSVSVSGKGRESTTIRVQISLTTRGPTQLIQIAEDEQEINSDGRIRAVLEEGKGNLDEPELVSNKASALRPNLHITISVNSFGISLIDSEPAEVVYASLQNIMCFVERVGGIFRFSLTLESAQIDNQLPNPLYPVNLFPRGVEIAHFNSLEGGSNRLMLPGLHQADGAPFPTLHMFMQQKLDLSASDEISGLTRESTVVSYYDMVTVWIAPVELRVDEETLVRTSKTLFEFKHLYSLCQSSAALKSYTFFNMIFSDATKTRESYNSSEISTCRGVVDVDPWLLSQRHQQMVRSYLRPYLEYSNSNLPSKSVYFSLLQLHPVDMVVSFKNTPDFKATHAAEETFLLMVAQLDSVRLCLNALVAERAFGSTSFLLDVIMKHYKNEFQKQLHKLIGSTDIVEGSVGLVTNLGTGVYDFFYEPIDGLLGENSSFLKGLSKGGMSLASKTIRGTSGFTSKLTGGIGKGVSMLTLDPEFQMKRAKKKLKTAHSVTEGLYVGTKELGHNIVEGVTGILVSPYRGWVEDGSLGLGLGIARGILGVALKPAVSVFDFASRATEGIRYSAFSSGVEAWDPSKSRSLAKVRPPRTFGRDGLLIPYEAETAAVQLVVDKLTSCSRQTRFRVLHHYTFQRLLPARVLETRVDLSGIAIGTSCLAVVSADRILLISVAYDDSLQFLWSCPAQCIEQLYSDSHGDLVLYLNRLAEGEGEWNSGAPVVHAHSYSDWVMVQIVCEKTIGVALARAQPLTPVVGAVEGILLKKYVTGLRSVLLSNTRQFYRLFGNVLYEYSLEARTSQDRERITAADSASYLNVYGNYKVPKGVLTCVYPLFDVMVEDPRKEESGRYSIQLRRKKKEGCMSVAWRVNEEDSRLRVGQKEELTLVTTSLKGAYIWKQALEAHSVGSPSIDTIQYPDEIPPNFKFNTSLGSKISAAFQSTSASASAPASSVESVGEHSKGRGVLEGRNMENSALRILTLPTANCEQDQIETLKVEIVKTLSTVRRSS